MNELQSLLYEAVLDVQTLADVLDQFASEECVGGTVFVADRAAGVIESFLVQSTFMEEALKITREYENAGKEIVRWLMEQKHNEFILAGDYYPAPDARRNNDLERRFLSDGVLERSAARLNLHGGWHDALTFNFRTADRRRLNAFHDQVRPTVPHFARVLDLNRRFRLLERKHQAVLAALDFFDIGVGITDTSGALIICNAQLEEILSARDGFLLDPHRRLATSGSEASPQLARAVTAAIGTVTEGYGPSVIRLAVKRRSESPAYVVEVSPMRQTSRQAEQKVIGALVLVIDPARRAAIRATSFEMLFSLTRAEMAVCELLLDGNDRNEMSEIRSVSPETIKSQVSSVFAKTQTRSRADLARLAVTINPPILDRRS